MKLAPRWLPLGLRVFLVLVCVQLLLTLPAQFWQGFLDTPLGFFLVLPYFSAYIAHAIGVPGLLTNNGACGWGWCAPTVLGWLVIVGVWLLVYGGLAKLIAMAIRRANDA